MNFIPSIAHMTYCNCAGGLEPIPAVIGEGWGAPWVASLSHSKAHSLFWYCYSTCCVCLWTVRGRTHTGTDRRCKFFASPGLYHCATLSNKRQSEVSWLTQPYKFSCYCSDAGSNPAGVVFHLACPYCIQITLTISHTHSLMSHLVRTSTFLI